MIFFKTITYTFFASVLFMACTESVGMPEPGGGEKATLRVALSFDGTGADTKAGSTAIPKTSWAIVYDIQFFLLSKPDNKVVYSYARPLSTYPPYRPGNTIFDGGEFVLTGVPVGDYKLVVLGNTYSSLPSGLAHIRMLNTTIDGGRTYTRWDSWNVLGKNAETDLLMTHNNENYGNPDGPHYGAPLAADGLSFHLDCPNIFKGTADVTIATGANRIVSPIPFTRIVSLMRLRFDYRKLHADLHKPRPFVTSEFFGRYTLLIFRAPKAMNMITGSSPMTLTDKEALFVTRPYNRDPSSTYYSPTQILDREFGLYSDVAVFPNNTGDSVEDDRSYKSVQPSERPALAAYTSQWAGKKTMVILSGFHCGLSLHCLSLPAV